MTINNAPIGEISGDFIIDSFSHKCKNGNVYYNVKCTKCGYITKMTKGKFLKNPRYHNNKNCGVWIREYDKYIGLTVNDYTIVDYLGKDGNNGQSRYLARCNVCGTEFNTLISNFNRGKGTRHECCGKHIPNDKYINRFRKIYSCMRYRTTNPNYNEYSLYGGRGISSDYFQDFMVFYKEMYESYKEHVDKYGEKDTSLDRIDVNGDYTPSNCRWATLIEQANNTRKNNYITINNETKTLAEWCKYFNINYGTVSKRIHKYGWSEEEALTTPTNATRRNTLASKLSSNIKYS